MTLVRWKPFADVPTFHNHISRLFDDAWQRSGVTEPGSWYPGVDIAETEDEFKLMAELPGLTRDDVKITLNDNVITLRGTKQSETKSKEDNWSHVERTYGAFERSFRLGGPVDKSKVRARFENGVLTVVLPKSEESRSREINIDN
jgi:HSP20 family protein